jgi:hypothetical protein
MVSYVLQNQAYVGNLVYWFRNGDKPSAFHDLRDSPTDRIVRCENAHHEIVDRRTWESVQTRLRLSSARKSDEMLLDELRAARSRWRPGKRRPVEIVTGQDQRRGYGRPDEEIITARTIREAIGPVVPWRAALPARPDSQALSPEQGRVAPPTPRGSGMRSGRESPKRSRPKRCLIGSAGGTRGTRCDRHLASTDVPARSASRRLANGGSRLTANHEARVRNMGSRVSASPKQGD